MREPDDLISRVALGDGERLADVARSGLLDSPPEDTFDRLTRAVRRALGVTVSLFSVVDDERQFFKSQLGLQEPWSSRRGSALSHSFCQHVVSADAPFIVTDARNDERVMDHPAIDDLHVVAYAGAPVHGPSGEVIGALCAIAAEPRHWTTEEIELLQDLADSASELIVLRDQADQQRGAAGQLAHHLRSSLTALQLEAYLHLGGPDEPAHPRTEALAETFTRHQQALDTALQVISSASAAPVAGVDLRTVLAGVAARSTAATGDPSREVRFADDDHGGDVLRPVAVAASAELEAIVEATVHLLLEHGAGTVTLRLVEDSTSVRVRVHDESRGLPPEVSTALARRSDNAVRSAEVSLAERAARCGARLMQTSSAPTTLDLWLPRG